MDFETVVGLLVFFFYVLPVILKKIRGKKKAAKQPTEKPAKQSLAQKFAEKAQLVIKELEKQAAENRKNKSGSKEDTDFWDHIAAADRSAEPVFDHFEPVDEEEEPEKPSPLAPVTAAAPYKPIKPAARVKPTKRTVPAPLVPTAADQLLPTTATTIMTPQALRNAVIWSEILSPPLALRNDG